MPGGRGLHKQVGLAAASIWLCANVGCAPAPTPSARVNVAPTTQPASTAVLDLQAADIQPMHREVLAINLAAALATAQAENLDILRARQQIQAVQGHFESTIGGALPSIGITSNFEKLDGTIRAVQGNLVPANFSTFQPLAAVQWMLNPGQVVYEAIAARKRLYASEQQEDAVVIETLRRTANQYYDLALAQIRVSTARQAVAEAQELLRINQLRSRTGTAVPADVLRAEARLAEHEQDLIQAMNAFYEVSIALAVTLRLDSAVTLAPRAEHLSACSLVRSDLTLDELVEYAIVYRPDLEAARQLVAAAAASKGATWWGSLGPQLQVAYQYGGITGNSKNTKPGTPIPNNLIVNPLSANGSFSPNPLVNGAIKESILRTSQAAARPRDQTFGLDRQERFAAGAGWRFSLSVIGDLKTAGALEQQALIEVERQLDQTKAQVVAACQASRTYESLIPLAQQQLDAAREAFRLTQANLQAGTMTTLDVLVAEDVVDQARLRHAEAVARYNQAQVDLLAAVGLLEASLLIPQVTSLPSD